MDKKLLLVGCLINIILLSAIGSAASPYISIDRYYNDIHFTNQSIPKPLVKIGEPFTLRFDMTVNQECQVHVELSDLGVYQGIESFVVVDGPSKLGKSHSKIYEANETFSYEWTLEPTERWAGGSMPIDLHYEIQLKERYGSVVSSEFTAAYVTISNEHYEPPATTKPGAQSSSDTSSPALPAFTLLGALMTMYMVYVLKKK
jgi:sarcinarray family protein